MVGTSTREPEADDYEYESILAAGGGRFDTTRRHEAGQQVSPMPRLYAIYATCRRQVAAGDGVGEPARFRDGSRIVVRATAIAIADRSLSCVV